MDIDLATTQDLFDEIKKRYRTGTIALARESVNVKDQMDFVYTSWGVPSDAVFLSSRLAYQVNEEYTRSIPYGELE